MMAKRGRPEAISKITCMNDPKKNVEKINQTKSTEKSIKTKKGRTKETTKHHARKK